MKQYIIHSTSQPAPLSGEGERTPWATAEVAAVDVYPWYAAGARQTTEARLLYDDDAVYAQFRCRDKHIHSQTTQLNGPVCLDSCVEFFATIDPAGGPDYFNLEINCCGVMLVGFGPRREAREIIGAELASRIRIAASIDAATKDESPDDAAWWVAAAVPFDVLSELAHRRVEPAAGDICRGNFYRCGGKTDPQFACWSEIDTPRPDFHRPEFFGELRFA